MESRRILQQDEERFGLPCRAGTEVDDFERSGTLSRTVWVRGVQIPDGSQFGTDCDFCYFWVRLAAATKVHGHELASGSVLEFAPVPPPLSAVGFFFLLPLYPFLAVRSLGDLRAQRVTVTPSAPLQIGPFPVLAGERILLSKDGRLEEWSLRSPRVVQGLPLQTGWLTFDRKGRLRELMLYRSQVLLGVPCFGSGLAGTEIRLHEDGSLARLVLAEDHRIGGADHPRGTRLDLAPDGSVKRRRLLKIDVAMYTPRPPTSRGGAEPPAAD